MTYTSKQANLIQLFCTMMYYHAIKSAWTPIIIAGLTKRIAVRLSYLQLEWQKAFSRGQLVLRERPEDSIAFDTFQKLATNNSRYI